MKEREKKGRIKVTAVCIFLLLYSVITVYTQTNIVLGDVNSDGSINIIDGLLTSQFYVELNPANFNEDAADVDGNNTINIIDALLIAQYYVGLITEFPGQAITPDPTDPPNITPDPSTPPTTVTIQAEDAYYNNAVVETDHAGYTGSGYVNTANEAGTYIEWAFTASTSANAVCVFTYANGGSASRPMGVMVNGTTVISTLDFPAAAAWDAWYTVSATVALSSGANTLRLTSLSSEGAANLDKVDITFNGIIGTPEPTATPEPTETPGPTNPQQAGVIGWATQNGGISGGSGGSSVTVSNFSGLESAVSGTDRRIVMISGTISGSGMMQIGSNKTILGSGTNSVISGFGFNLNGQTNVIIQNITFTNANDDSINVQEYSTNIWIDHCSFTNGYDGLVDIKRGSSFITVSWNHFYNHGKTCLLGHSDDNASQDVGNLKVTYHHNFFDNTDTRHPRVRFGHVHVFNNYYIGNEYGVASTMNADVLVEGNYFSQVGEPTLVGYGSSGPGDLVERNNIYDNCQNGPRTQGSVPSFPYSYSLDNASSIPSIVRNGAGVGKM